MVRSIALFCAALQLACASTSPAPSADRAAVWGYVRLVPRDGVAAITGGAQAYGDREVADAVLVDYSKPGFAVVYADGPPPPAAGARLAIRDGVTSAVFEPANAALGAGAAITVVNESGTPHVLSCPNARLVRRLAPGDSVEIATDRPGEWPLFLLDAGTDAHVFAAPGPFQVVSSAGRFALADLPPGPLRLHAWHPRFPSGAVAAELAGGVSQRLDIELRVEPTTGEKTDAP